MVRDGKSHRVLDVTERLDRPFPIESDPELPDEDPLERAIGDAKDRGYQEGREQAEGELAREIADFRSVVSDSLRRLAELESSLPKRLEAQLLEIALDAASKIVRRQLDDGEAVALRALQEAMESLPLGEGLQVRLHPADLEVVAAELKAEVETGRVAVVADPGMTRGGCVVESAAGTIDATVETAEAAIRSAVLGGEGMA